jgi:hypothetical protein
MELPPLFAVHWTPHGSMIADPRLPAVVTIANGEVDRDPQLNGTRAAADTRVKLGRSCAPKQKTLIDQRTFPWSGHSATQYMLWEH